jgi:hypothetical protein
MEIPDTEAVIEASYMKAINMRKYQRMMYLRRKEKMRVLEEAKLKEKSQKLKEQILASGGILQSSPNASP